MSEVKQKGRRHVTSLGAHHIYEYKSPGITFPNERKTGEELAELSGGVTVTQLSEADMERYLKTRSVGRLSKVKGNS